MVPRDCPLIPPSVHGAYIYTGTCISCCSCVLAYLVFFWQRHGFWIGSWGWEGRHTGRRGSIIEGSNAIPPPCLELVTGSSFRPGFGYTVLRIPVEVRHRINTGRSLHCNRRSRAMPARPWRSQGQARGDDGERHKVPRMLCRQRHSYGGYREAEDVEYEKGRCLLFFHGPDRR